MALIKSGDESPHTKRLPFPRDSLSRTYVRDVFSAYVLVGSRQDYRTPNRPSDLRHYAGMPCLCRMQLEGRSLNCVLEPGQSRGFTRMELYQRAGALGKMLSVNGYVGIA